MNKNKNIIRLAFFFLAVSGMFFSREVLALEKGVAISFMTMNDLATSLYCRSSAVGWNQACGTLRYFKIYPNINFNLTNSNNFDTLGDFGTYRRKPTPPVSHNFAKLHSWSNYMYVPSDGNYYFSTTRTSGIEVRLKFGDSGQIDPLVLNGNGLLKCPTCSPIDGVYLKAGWNRFEFTANIGTTVDYPNTLILRRGTTTDIASHVVIPEDDFSWEGNSKTEVTIPEDSKPEAKINFYTAGTGVNDALGAGQDPKITLEIPNPGPSNADFSVIGDAYVFWYDNTSDSNPTITIENKSISVSKPITGTRLTTPSGGIPLGSIYAPIDPALIQFDEGTRKMELVFHGLSWDKINEVGNSDGISIILPYKDENIAKPTRLYLKFIAMKSYDGTHSPITFDLDAGIDKTNLKPIIFFPDGNTKEGASIGKYRPNYMYMASGVGTKPNKDSWLVKDYPSDLVKIFPKTSDAFSLANVNSWYSVFGREKSAFDVVSAQGNYLPNKETGDYVGTEDGVMNTINAEGKDWVSFQLYSSNFSEDGVAGHPDSGGLSVIGLLGGKKNPKVVVCPRTFSTKISKGDTIDFETWYWENYGGAEDYCNETLSAVNVTAPSSISSSDNAIVNLIDQDTDSFKALTGGSAQIRAEYFINGVNLQSEGVDVTVSNIETCNYNLCDKSTNYECKEVLGSGDGCSQIPVFKDKANCSDTTPPVETCKPDGWKEATP